MRIGLSHCRRQRPTDHGHHLAVWLLAAVCMGKVAFLIWHLHGADFIPFFHD